MRKKASQIKNILIVNPFGIGDVLFSTPLIKVIKNNFSESKLYYISNKRTYEVLKSCPDLEGVFIFEKQKYRDLWKESKTRCIKQFLEFFNEIKDKKIDIVFDLSMGHQYSFFFMLLGVPERIGFNYRKRGRFLTRKMKFSGFNDKPIAEYYLDLARLLNLRIEKPTTKIWPDKGSVNYINEFFKIFPKSKDLLIGVMPGGGVSFGAKKIAFKRWDPENFAELNDRLIKDLNGEVILIWAPGEERLVKEITFLMKNKPKIAPHTTLNQMAALMKKCDLVITNDSGPLHVARAAGAKTISIFGPSDERVYGPYPPGKDHLVVTKDINCRPCYKKFRLPDCQNRACLRELYAKSVFTVVANQIRNLKTENAST